MNTSKTFIRKPLVAAIGGVLAGTAAPVALAQSVDASSGMLEEIVVTASRREQNIQDIPYNISAIDGSEIDAGNMVDSAELMRSVAGISVVDRGARNAGHVNNLVIRGINVDNGANGDTALSAGPTVATYIDNTPLFASFLLKDIQRVEILRGPQGTLYGSSALGGTVKYIMNRPDSSGFDASVGMSYGQTKYSDGNNLSYDGMVNIPLGDSVALRISAGVVDNDGFIDYNNAYVMMDGKPAVMDDAGACRSVNDPALTATELTYNGSCYEAKKDTDFVDIQYARAALRFQPSDTLDIQLNYMWQEDETGGRRSISTGGDYYGNLYNGIDQSGLSAYEPSNRDAQLISLDVEWDLGFATLTSSTSAYEHNGDGWRDNTGIWVTNRSSGFVNWFSILYPGNPRPVAHVNAGFMDEAIIQEFRLVSNDSDSSIDWTVGAFYMDQDREAFNYSYLLGLESYATGCLALGEPECTQQWWMTGEPMSEIDFHYQRQEKFTDMSVYGEVTWHASDSLHITGGIRWFDNELSNVTAWSFPLFVGVDVPFVPYPTQQEDDVQLKLNVAYDLSENTMGYFTYSEGFRRGGSNAIPATGYFAEPNPTSVDAYYADTVQNYEIGIKGTTDRIRYSADIYFIDWKDPQLNTATAFWSFFMAQNGTSAETQGFELEAQFALTDGLDLNLGYGYAKGELTADLIAPQFGNVLATKGHRLPGTAEKTLTASIRHSTEVANGLTLSTRIGGYFQSDSINSVTDTDVQEAFNGFSMWNMSMTLGNENWSASLFMKNITNEQGTTASIPEAFTGIDSGTFENFYANTSRRYIVSPQTIGLALKYNF